MVMDLVFFLTVLILILGYVIYERNSYIARKLAEIDNKNKEQNERLAKVEDKINYPLLELKTDPDGVDADKFLCSWRKHLGDIDK